MEIDFWMTGGGATPNIPLMVARTAVAARDALDVDARQTLKVLPPH
eukprot:CAMPEP_0114020584 /NCGR_PEP_ID=MMETSP0372-20130328/17634_1 /TAXON_ID=340204 /ORGANISM="Lankesteria abbotti" /LENGTH=45 /assembly_acc=CAM_ASM_000359